ncbi:MAG TPA: ABC transporter permease subunit [Actinomycetes bacterium]|jgi:general L-amino acid transport system permease protein|nr:ABC transporter permease subunit [Actinomycetes bacterium]
MSSRAQPPAGRWTSPVRGLWRNVRVRRVAFQLGFVVLVAALLLYLYSNLLTNLRRLRIGTSFAFLDQSAGFAIANSDFQPSESFLAAILVGVQNTVLVSLLGIVLATMLGFVVGVARLSTNWLVRRAAAGYVETLRNVPVLVVILFWYLGVILQMPPIERAVEWGGLVLSNRGLVIPWLKRTGDPTVFLTVVGAGVVVAGATAVWRTRRWDRTGLPHHRILWAGGILLAAALVGFVAGGFPLSPSLPERGDLGTEHGYRLTPEYGALLLGLSVYTASHIAEIVRGGILAVPKGQTEAANALALSGFQRLRFVVLPQAFRIMIPPLANQYLNLTKNSSLGVAIAYPEVTRVVRIAIGQQAPAPQAVAVLMLVYLGFSLAISLVANLLNRRLALKGRI